MKTGRRGQRHEPLAHAGPWLEDVEFFVPDDGNGIWLSLAELQANPAARKARRRLGTRRNTIRAAIPKRVQKALREPIGSRAGALVVDLDALAYLRSGDYKTYLAFQWRTPKLVLSMPGTHRRDVLVASERRRLAKAFVITPALLGLLGFFDADLKRSLLRATVTLERISAVVPRFGGADYLVREHERPAPRPTSVAGMRVRTTSTDSAFRRGSVGQSVTPGSMESVGSLRTRNRADLGRAFGW